MIHFTVFLTTLLLSGCSPSMKQMESYDMTRQLNSDTLFVPLQNEDEEIEMLQKFGKEKKAKRLIKSVDKHNAKLKEAFNSNYQFSKVEFVKESEIDKSLPHAIIESNRVHTQKNNDFETTLKIAQNDELIVEVNISHKVENNFNANHLVKSLNNKLEKFHSKSMP